MRMRENMNAISARRTDLLDDDEKLGSAEEDILATGPHLSERDWFQADIPPYQDDLDIDPKAIDPVMAELSDDPTELFGVSPLAFREELGKTATDEGWDTDVGAEELDDYRETIEDRDQDGYNLAA